MQGNVWEVAQDCRHDDYERDIGAAAYGKTAWDLGKGRKKLQGTDAYRRLNPNKLVEPEGP